jgi:hypothetical protein
MHYNSHYYHYYPTKVRARTVYTVTAKNATDNTGSTVFSLTVNAQTPATSNSRLSRFTEVDVSSANNDNDGYYNASNYPNSNAFAALKTDGSITAWGDSNYGGILRLHNFGCPML